MGKRRDRQGRQAARRPGGGRRVGAGYVIAAAVAVVIVGGFIALVLADRSQRASSGPPSGVESINVGPPGRHTERPVKYAQTPPAGGPHNPVWQNCGFYSKPVRNENAVHSLEHGAVWITYRPDLPKDQVQEIKSIANGKTYILASPYKGLPAPVVASAWGKQLRLDPANDSGLRQLIRSYLPGSVASWIAPSNDSRLQQFIRYYRQGPQTPEPGAACTGGTGSPS